MSQPEKETIDTFNSMLRSVERFIKQVYEQDKVDYLKKAGFRQDIKPERLDLIIQQLQKVRKGIKRSTRCRAFPISVIWNKKSALKKVNEFDKRLPLCGFNIFLIICCKP